MLVKNTDIIFLTLCIGINATLENIFQLCALNDASLKIWTHCTTPLAPNVVSYPYPEGSFVGVTNV